MAGELSTYGRLLLDYATQAAKRQRNEAVLPVHVALAALQRDRPKAENEWGDFVGQIEEYARRLPTSVSTPVIDEATLALLQQINNAGDEWAVLKAELPKYLTADIPGPSLPGSTSAGSQPAAVSAADPPGATPFGLGVPAPATADAGITGVLARFVTDLKPVVASLPHPVESDSAVVWATADTAERALLNDLLGVFRWLASADGTWDEAELRLLQDFFVARADSEASGALLLQPGSDSPDAAQDDLVVGPSTPLFCALLAADEAGGTNHAEHFARGLVRVAQSICSVDHSVGMDEARRLDQLRVEFREVLVHTAGSHPSTVLVGNQATADSLGELEALVGLAGVKEELRAFIQLAWMNQLRQERGHMVSLPTLHMAFLGNPGTGKTTVARLLGRIFGGLGILTKGHFVEVDRLALIGEYVGHTAPKVHALIDKCRGGVLFIDEAYSLTPPAVGGNYEREAIDTLMKLMEDLRHEVVVVMAGYPDLMVRFFGSNPGLSGRIATHLYFPDLSLDELMEVFDGFCRQNKRVCQANARSQVRKVLDVMRQLDRFGNGRDVRNLYELLERRQAARLAPLGEFATDEDLATFILDDIPAPPETQIAPGTYL